MVVVLTILRYIPLVFKIFVFVLVLRISCLIKV